jgi:Tol biopolymer transport system component
VKILLVGVSLAAAALAGGARGDLPAPQLVVSSDYTRWSDDHVFVWRPGGRLRALALGSAATASPDGRRVAFLRDGALWTVRSDSRGERRIAALTGEHWLGRGLTWSPDGSRVAVPVVGRGTDIVDLEARTVSSVQALSVGFSADGTQMAYVDADGLEVADVDGSPPRLVAPDWFDAIGIAWSHDSRWLAISATARDGNPRVALMRPDGSDASTFSVGGFARPPGRATGVSPGSPLRASRLPLPAAPFGRWPGFEGWAGPSPLRRGPVAVGFSQSGPCAAA